MTDPIINIISTFISTNLLRQPNRLIAPEEAILSTGLVDSFSLVDLALFIEDTFGVHLEDTELNRETFDSIVELVALIHSRQ